MKKHVIQWMKTLFCCLVLFAVMTPIPVHAEWVDGVELYVQKWFGESHHALWNGCEYWEEGNYVVTGLTDDTYDVTVKYYLKVRRNTSTVGDGYTYQTVPVTAYIDGKALGTFDARGTNYYHGDYLLGTASTTVERGKDNEYILADGAADDGVHTAINVKGIVNIDLPKYTVTFTNGAWETLKTESVTRHGSATAPANPSITGYTFNQWDKGWSPVTSNITVNATWNRNPPSINIRETVYEKGQNVTTGKLIENAIATDERQGNITNKVVPLSPIIHGNTVDTSTPGSWDITYRVTNDDDVFNKQDKTVEKPGKIIIVDTGSRQTFNNGTDATIYSRNISGKAMLNGQVPSNNLTPYSIWRSDTSASMNRMLNDSLHRTNPLYTVNGVYGQ